MAKEPFTTEHNMPLTLHYERNGLQFFQLEHHQFEKPVQGFYKQEAEPPSPRQRIQKGNKVHCLDGVEANVNEVWQANPLNPYMHDLPFYGFWCTIRRFDDGKNYITPYDQLSLAT